MNQKRAYPIFGFIKFASSKLAKNSSLLISTIKKIPTDLPAEGISSTQNGTIKQR